MSFAFTATELSDFRVVQTGHMMDTCVIGVHGSTTDAHGQEIASYTDGAPVDCGLGFPQQRAGEFIGPDGNVISIDAELRLSIANGEGVSPHDRITITKRHGETLSTQQVYEVAGLPKRGPSGVVLPLVRFDR